MWAKANLNPILGWKNKISSTVVCPFENNWDAQMTPNAQCYSNVLHHSWIDYFMSASGAHLQCMFTSTESGTVFTGAGTSTFYCLVSWDFFLCTGIQGITQAGTLFLPLHIMFSGLFIMTLNKLNYPEGTTWCSSVRVIACLLFSVGV